MSLAQLEYDVSGRNEMLLPGPPEFVAPSRVFGILRRRKWIVLLVTALLVIPATFVIMGLTPYYDATSAVVITADKPQFANAQLGQVSPLDSVAVATQVEIIKSPAVAMQVTQALDLAHAPEFVREMDSVPLSARLENWIGGLFVGPQPAPPPLTDEERQQVAAGLLAKRMTVSNDGRSDIITVTARTEDSHLSAAIANSYSDAYLAFNRALKTGAIGKANALLDTRIAPLQAKVHDAEQAVQRFRETHGLILNRPEGAAVGGGETVASQQLQQINAQLVQAQNDLTQHQASLDQTTRALKTGGYDDIPQVVDSPLIQHLREQEADSGSLAASLSQTNGSRSPNLMKAQAARGALRQRIQAEVAKIVASMSHAVNADRARVEALKTSMANVQQQVVGQSQATVGLQQLESQAQAARDIYKQFLDRFEQTSNQGDLQQPNADLISAAQRPLSPTGPARLRLLLAALVGSAMLGSLVGLIVERFRNGIRTAEQLEAQTGLFALGFLPQVGRRDERASLEGRLPIYGEAVSLVRSMLQYGAPQYRSHVVLITSALPREGKTFFAVSLAASVGHNNGRALLIDCDLRRPGVARTLNISDREHGRLLTDTGSTLTLRQDVRPGLDVLTFAEGSRSAQSIVASDKMRILIDEARANYDLIVLDAPPVLAFANARSLSLAADAAIMVVRWRSTPSHTVLSAAKTLRAYGVRLLGGVITQVRLAEMAASEGSHAYLYRKHGGYFT
jgi:succinoglycan biosynthesis transport protein ExoP